VEFLSNFDVKPPLHKRKAPRPNVKLPYWRLSGDASSHIQHKKLLNRTDLFISEQIKLNQTDLRADKAKSLGAPYVVYPEYHIPQDKRTTDTNEARPLRHATKAANETDSAH